MDARGGTLGHRTKHRPGQCAAAQGQVEAERKRGQDEVDKYKYYPVLNIGITIGW